jgi:hypothetical protein
MGAGAVRLLEVEAFPFDDEGAMKDLGVDGGDVLAQHAGEEELDR